MKSVYLPVFVLLFSFSINSQAGTFWFPIEGHYPYSSNLKITAIPDLDRNTNSIKTRLWQKGIKNSQTITVKGLNAFTKNGGGDWDFDGVRYNDSQGGTGKKYVWYDNHNGYDFITTGLVKDPQIFSVEAGKVINYDAEYGQVGIEHNINGIIYRTYYTHMKDIPTNVQIIGSKVSKWQLLGRMSNKSKATEPVGVHLHFTTKKKVGTVGDDWVIVDPYGHKPNWPSDTTDDPNNPYLWQ
ncbi:MAG: Peptidase family M23 [Parcubacteria bacterium OLB19]|jgi:hypothetical protein|nr:MAG: Peptidase family M23 [Parcubacteria bacterium OLB19]